MIGMDMVADFRRDDTIAAAAGSTGHAGCAAED